MRKYYAAFNYSDFANTWKVYAFESKSTRDRFVHENDGFTFRNNICQCLVIKKNQVTRYAANWSLTRNELIAPKPFTEECWVIDGNMIDRNNGCIGQVVVGHVTDNCERLFSR